MLRLSLLILVALLHVLGASCSAALAAGKRVALVIGNADYADVGSLANPTADAATLAAALREASFDDVKHVTNLSAEAMRDELKAFSARSAAADVAVIYYAGHGVEVADQNYLVPVDAKLTRASDIEFEAISLASVRNAVAGATKLRVVILDACRNNPFSLAGNSGTRAATRGLGRIEPGAGEVVAYAAKEGTLAQDGPRDTNSPFAAALAKSLKQPGLEIRLLFGQVRDDVLSATGNEQEPYTYASLGGEAIFLSPPRAQSATAATEEWKLVSDSANVPLLEAFRDKYRHDAVFLTLATDRLAQIAGPKVIKDCADCPDMVTIPAGRFVMGSPPHEKHHQPDEGPQHDVSLARAFAVGKFEVTVAQFKAFIDATGHDMTGGCSIWNGTRFVAQSDNNFGNPGFAQTNAFPATCLSWRDAIAYVDWLSQRSGKPYRLMSEAEWEYVARAGTQTAYLSGDAPNRGEMNFKSAAPQPVGQYAANAFGLHDTQGNVWEWTQDCYHKTYDATPTDGAAASNIPNCKRIYRGGAWSNEERDLRLAARGGNSEGLRVNIFGLRVARDLE
jgi:formylglycine-generating enzyme required for sulfatase activity